MTAPERLRLGEHLGNPLYRTGYFLIIGTGVTAAIGIAFWALAARTYEPHEVGLSSTVISASTLVSGISTLGLSAVLVRYLPLAGRATRRFILWTYGVTAVVSLVLGTVAALGSHVWAPRLGFLAQPGWVIAFALATVAATIFALQDNVLVGLKAPGWIPLENSLYSLAKLAVLIAFAGSLSRAGPFIAWNAPLPIAILLVNLLVFRRLVPAQTEPPRLERDTIFAMARGNFLGTLFSLVAGLYMPILVATATNPTQTAYFYAPWMICLGMQLIALNMTTSLTVEAATDMAQLRGLTRQALTHSMKLVVPMSVLTAVAAPWILLAFGQAYADAGAGVLRLLAIGMIPNVVVAVGIGVARIEHRSRAVVAVQAVNAILTVGLSAALLSSIGIVAVGIAFVTAQCLLAVSLILGPLRPLVLS